MSKLVYGIAGQLRFLNEEEKEEAINYIRTNIGRNVKIVHEDNQLQGARGPEDRIIFYSSAGVPECLLRNMTAGTQSYFGRINCNEFIEELRSLL